MTFLSLSKSASKNRARRIIVPFNGPNESENQGSIPVCGDSSKAIQLSLPDFCSVEIRRERRVIKV